MRLSTIAFCVLPITSLALPTVPGDVSDVVVAGPIATKETVPVLTELEIEYQKLEVLKAQLHDLHHRVSHQEHAILKLINEDFATCSGLGCYLQTAVRKAPDFFELFRTHFRHHPSTKGNATAACSWNSTSDAYLSQVDIPAVTNTLQAPPHPPHSDPSEHESQQPNDGLFEFDERPSNKPFEFDEQPVSHPPHLPPMRPSDFHRPDKDHRLPFEPPLEWRPPHGHPPDHNPWRPNDEDHRHWGSEEADHPPKPHHRRPHHLPHPAPRHRHYRLIMATAGFIITVLILGILFKALRMYLENPRVRANRAACIEERRTRREYKRAACQHRFRKMLARLTRRSKRRGDMGEEEKESMLQASSDEQRVPANGHIMGANIESLRRAHEIVGQLVRAEEGRSNTLRGFTPGSPTSTAAPSIVTTLPPYGLPPPRYSQELSRDMEVVDGFRYTPSNSELTPSSGASDFMFEDDDLAESSVVDCRSRMSVDTDGLSLPRKSLELAGDRYRGQFN